MKNLKNLEPTIKALADVGPDFGMAFAAGSVFPFTQNFVDRAVRGDYFNLHVDLDLTIPRLKRACCWERTGGSWEQLIPAPGDRITWSTHAIRCTALRAAAWSRHPGRSPASVPPPAPGPPRPRPRSRVSRSALRGCRAPRRCPGFGPRRDPRPHRLRGQSRRCCPPQRTAAEGSG